MAVAHGEHPKAGGEETGKARRAYQIAREIPDVAAQMPCFCDCGAFGHENLLDCFIDQHGAG